ncbi:MAD2L1-binding protein-like [Mizuhopecten yessoensis]|uniref:MAD2L1-binding protein-like n=1 Tax=Mizuhopecten yessoensis TaxID=6573 RepID=UPI000B45D0F7|nr:MAD2L1-binding protein-like [Mizuhopecten yessoensis]
MARRKEREQDRLSCTFVFDGTLQSRVRGTLVIELIKYLLYERQQIPLPIDYVKQELKRISESQLGNEQNGGRKPKSRQLNKLEIKRATNTLKNFDELSSHVLQVFEICPEIHQALLMFGGTSVSPKESYLVNLPGINPEAEGLPLKTCVRSLYRQLISQDIVGGSKPIGTTCLRVLLHAPREAGVEWFLPKPAFRVPMRGKQYVMNFCGKHSNSYGHNITRDEYEIEISGIEPLECSNVSVPLEDENEEDLSFLSNKWLHNSTDGYNNQSQDSLTPKDTNSTDTLVESVVNMQFNDVIDESADERVFTLNKEQYMWFQAPLVVKGYRDRTSRQASMTDGLM